MYDITNKKSFYALENWLKDIKEQGSKNIEVIIVGNKSDKSYEREVSYYEAFDFCQKNRIDYIEVSALNGNNVNEIFEKISRSLTKKANESGNNSKNNSRVKLQKSLNASKIKEENESPDYSIYDERIKKKSKCC